MKNVLLILFTLLISLSSEASTWIAGSYGMRFENDSAKEQMASRSPIGLVMGKRWKTSEIVVEYQTFSIKTGNKTLEISRKSELIASEYRFYPFRSESVSWYPYITGGGGLYREKITTRFLSQTDRRDSKLYPTVIAGAGTWGSLSSRVRLGAEFRVLISEAFNPTGLLDLGIRLGFSF